MMTLWENDDDALGMSQRHTVAHHSYKDRRLLGKMVYIFSNPSWEIYTVSGMVYIGTKGWGNTCALHSACFFFSPSLP